MKRAAIIICWISVILAGVFLRFDHLSKRPFHADEATGARITSSRMESGNYHFDPVHYHGPLLSSLAIPICRISGETQWNTLTKFTLRLLPAIAGSLLLFVPLFWRKRFGDAPMLVATLLFATSPLLVYYSRMFIHESLLVFFGMMTLAMLVRFPRHGLPGLMVGLMFATKETFAISLIAWSAAGIFVLLEIHRTDAPSFLISWWKQHWKSVLLSLFIAAVRSMFFYTDGFLHLHGIVDSVRTFFVYQTTGGHDKAFGYYFHLLAVPSKAGGFWWFGTPVVLLAVLAYSFTFRSNSKSVPWFRFIAYSAVGHFLIYSLIAYKTPWLACLPWAHVCLLAGFAVVNFNDRKPVMKMALILLVGFAALSQFVQSRHVTGRLASDDRNPFAYVPTRNEIETLPPFLENLRLAAPSISQQPIAVIGSNYWPLPWYLRDFKEIGYWPEPPSDLESHPLVFAMPETMNAVADRLTETHVAIPRGLRAGIPIEMFIRKDVWKLWMKNDDP